MPSVSPTGSVTPIGLTELGAGIRLHTGIVLPSAGNVVAYVGASSLSESLLDNAQKELLVTTLNTALKRCRAGKGDIVIVMPDHAEDISAADQMSNLVAGTKIIGMGHGQLRPTFTWTATAASFLLDQANVMLSGLHLVMASAANAGVTVTAPITVSAAGCSIVDCRIDFGADSNDNVTKGIVTTAAADDFTFAYNRCFGATAAECTTFLELVGTDRVKIVGNYIKGATSAVAVGIVRALTTAFTDGLIAENFIANHKADSEEAITLINSCTGAMVNNRLSVLDATSTNLDNNGDMAMFGNLISNAAGGIAVGLS